MLPKNLRKSAKIGVPKIILQQPGCWDRVVKGEGECMVLGKVTIPDQGTQKVGLLCGQPIEAAGADTDLLLSSKFVLAQGQRIKLVLVAS